MKAWRLGLLHIACAAAASLKHFGRLANPTHYGDPKTGCRSDERNVTVQGVLGDLCSPPCGASNHSCPHDVPAGVQAATAECALTYADQQKGCCLVCSPLSDQASLRAGDVRCGSGATCQPVQSIGVCTYGAPPSSALPRECHATGSGSVVCAGNASPEPGCEKINQLCCATQLPDAIAALLRYRLAHPFNSLSLACPGNFGGGNASWARTLGRLLTGLPALKQLHLDLSWNMRGGDTLVDAIEAALVASPGLTNFSLLLDAANLSDVGAARLGQLLGARFRGSALRVSVERNGPDDVTPMPHPLTPIGAKALAAGISALPTLQSLTLSFDSDTNLTATGIAKVARALKPLARTATLTHLDLDLGYVTIKGDNPGNRHADSALACLGRTLGALNQSLRYLRLNMDCTAGAPPLVRALGVHLACLPVAQMTLPGFDDRADCHCGLAVDRQRHCLVPNKNFRADLGSDCFQCLPQANATACEMFGGQ